jgi:probable rRNA maturation factor
MLKPKVFLHNTSSYSPPINEQIVNQVVTRISEEEKVIFGSINIIFMGTDEHTRLNIKNLGHTHETDILTFDLSDSTKVNTDIYINVDVAQTNAQEYNEAISHEFYRLCIHGLLHMAGYNDHTDQEKLEMRKREDYYLKVSCET